MNEDKVKRNSRPILIAIIVALILCIAGLLIFWLFFSEEAVAKREIKEKLELADRYLDELDYDRAITCYKAVLKIDPANTEVLYEILDAYLDWAKEEEDPAEADSILAEAEEYFTKLAEEAEYEEVAEEAERIVKKIQRKRGEIYKTPAEPGVRDEDEGEPDEEGTADEGRREAEPVQPEDLPDRQTLEGLLEAFALFQDVEYDYESAMYSGSGPDALLSVVFSYGRVSACYPMKVTEIWDESEKDPKGLFPMFAYISYDDLHWVYHNVYNCSEEDAQRLLKTENDYRYNYGETVYFNIGGVGGPQSLYIDDASYDGVDYVVNYHIGYPVPDGYDYDFGEPYYQAVVRHKMNGTTGYWSIYSNRSAQRGATDGQASAAYKEAYDRFLKEIDTSCPHDLVYTEIYLDDDDIPELVVADYQNALAWSDGYIFTYRNNEVTFLGSIGYTSYGCFDYYEYGGLALCEFAHTGTYGKSYMHVGSDNVSYHVYMAANYDIQTDMSFSYEESSEENDDWEIVADENGFNVYRPYREADISTVISRADFEGSDTKELKSVKGKKLRSLTEDDYRYVSER